MLVLLTSRAVAGEPCLRRVLQEFDYVGGREVHYSRVEGVRVRQGQIKVQDLVGKKDEVLIGASWAHAYLYVDGVRYDGGVLFKPSGGVKTKVTAVTQGTLIRFKDLPAEQIARLRAQLLEHKGTLIESGSCVHGICRELSAAGIEVRGGRPWMPAALYERMLADGFTDSQGKPLEIEIIKTDLGDLHETVEDFQDAQDEIAVRLAAKGATYLVKVGGAAAVAGGVYYVYTHLSHASPVPKATGGP